MRGPRFRLRSLMILILITAIVLGVGIPLSRLNLNEIHDLKPRALLLGTFLLLVVAKLGLLVGLRARRYQTMLHGGEDEMIESSRETPSS